MHATTIACAPRAANIVRLSRPTVWQRLSPTLFACMATLLSLPVQAATTDVDIPDVPLQSGTAYPAPNIMFILDDSGSMEWDFMPGAFAGDDSDIDRKTDYDTDDSDKGMRVGLQTAEVNRLYYDPAIDYKPWIKADGTRHSGGTSIHEVFTDDNLLRGNNGSDDPHDDLGDSDDVETFYVPKPGETADDARNFYRYQIRRVGDDGVTGPRVVRSEYGNTSSIEHEDLLVTGISGGRDSYSDVYSIEVPEGASELIFTISVEDSDDEGADLYVRYENDFIRTWEYDWRENDRNSYDDISIDNPNAGTYYVVVRGIDSWYTGFDDLTLRGAYYMPNASAVANAGCPGDADDDGNWINCTFATPDIGADGTSDDRTEAAEIENFATWYSYHRTRIKTAKAGASEAFSQLSDNYRVGYDSIWNRTRGVASNDPSAPTSGPAYAIPTGVDEGLFKDQNREKWFEYLQTAVGNNGTPLQAALQRTGEYYESAAPWDSGDGADISCRQSFAILTTDGYWNSRDSGYDYIGDIDSKSGEDIYPPPTMVDGVETPGVPYTYEPANPYQDADPSDPEADTLADVAMHYWNRDLRPTLDNNVSKSADDEAFWQHMVTFGVSIGLQGRLNPATDLNDITIGSKNWPNPNNEEDQDRIDDLWHASVNGHGKFVAATNPQQFVSGLLDALATVAERPGSASNVTANSTSFRTDTRVYQASYVSGRWVGELAAFDASSAGVATTPAWQASEQMPVAADRAIWTWGGAAGATFPTTAQIAALDASARTLAPATGAENAAYIAGDQSLEKINDGVLRNRGTVLGDIANSSPTYVQDTDTIFVGANDGMLHAFNASTGEERFAYVPAGIDLAKLATLSDPHYTHEYFVDGPITVSATSQTPGHNYLIGALGRGGRGVFGLDVTDPTAFDAADVLWEYSNDSDMGLVLGEPLVVTLNDADNTDGSNPKAVIVSNGINSPDGSATVFVINLATGAIIAEIEAGTAGGNGLSAPRGWDNDGNGTLDFLYAGDIKGQLWKFDFTGSTSDSWVVANSGSPMFTATDSAGNAQPITAGLALAKDPETGKRWVFVGTGSFMTTVDLTSTGTQSIYGVIDDGTVTGRTSTTDFGDLVNREILVVGTSATGLAIRGFALPVATLESGRKGWVVDLDTPATTYAERVVSGPRIFGGGLIFSSIIPPTGNTCDAGGSGYVNALDPFTGASLSPAFFDTDGDGDFDDNDGLTVTVDGEEVVVPPGSVDLDIGMPTRPTIIGKLLVVGGSTGGIGSLKINPPGEGARRISWREIRGD